MDPIVETRYGKLSGCFSNGIAVFKVIGAKVRGSEVLLAAAGGGMGKRLG